MHIRNRRIKMKENPFKVTFILGLLAIVFLSTEITAIPPFGNFDDYRFIMKKEITSPSPEGKFIFVVGTGKSKPILLINFENYRKRSEYSRHLVYRKYCEGDYTVKEKIWMLIVDKCSYENKLLNDENLQNQIIVAIQNHIDQVSERIFIAIRVDFSKFRKIDYTLAHLVKYKLKFMKLYSVSPFSGLIDDTGVEKWTIMGVNIDEKKDIIKTRFRDHRDPSRKGVQQIFYKGTEKMYFLPWKTHRIVKMQLGLKNDIFFTAALMGCSVFATGSDKTPTVYHAGIDGAINEIEYHSKKPENADPILVKLAKEKKSIEFWRKLLDILEPQARGDYRFGEIAKTDYLIPGGSPTLRAVRFANAMNVLHKLDGLDVTANSTWGTVFGFRRLGTGRWRLFLQENVFLEVQLKGSDKKKQIHVPISVRKFFPGGLSQVNIIDEDNWPRLRINYN